MRIIILMTLFVGVCYSDSPTVERWDTGERLGVVREHISEIPEDIILVGTFMESEPTAPGIVIVSTETYSVGGYECFRVKMGTSVIYGRYPTTEEATAKEEYETYMQNYKEALSSIMIDRLEKKIKGNRATSAPIYDIHIENKIKEKKIKEAEK